MNNWFSVGEEVIVVNPIYPNAGGEYTVTEIVDIDSFKQEVGGAFINYSNHGCFYRLKDYRVTGTGTTRHNGVAPTTDLCGDKHLRKKHKGSDLGYSELIHSLNTKQQERV